MKAFVNQEGIQNTTVYLHIYRGMGGAIIVEMAVYQQ